MKCKTILLLVLLHTAGAFGQIYNPDTISVTTTPHSLNWLLNTDASDDMDDLGFSAFQKSRVADADAAARLAGLGIEPWWGTSFGDANNAEFSERRNTGVLNVRHYGAVGDGVTDDTDAVALALAKAMRRGGIVYFPPGEYECELTIADNGVYPDDYGPGRVWLCGAGAGASIVRAVTTGHNWLTVTGYTANNPQWRISGLRIDGDERDSSGIAVTASGGSSLVVADCCFFECADGYRNTGSIYQQVTHCAFERCGYGSALAPLATMHGGDIRFEWCHWYGNHIVAFYVDGTEVTASMEQVVVSGCIMQGGLGLSIMAHDLPGTWPLVFEDIYFEGGGTGTDLAVDGVDGNGSLVNPPVVRLQNVARAEFTRCKSVMTDWDIKDSVVSTEACWYYEDASEPNITGASVVIGYKDYLDGTGCFDPNIIIEKPRFNMGGATRFAGVRVPLTHQTIRTDLTNLLPNGSQAAAYVPTANGNAYSFEQGGPGFGHYLTFVLATDDDTYGEGVRTAWSWTMATGKYYVFSFDIRGDGGTYTVDVANPNAGFPNLTSKPVTALDGIWTRYVSMTVGGYTGASTGIYWYNGDGQTTPSYDLANTQLIEFDTLLEAQAFVDAGTYVPDTAVPRLYCDDLPVTGATYSVTVAQNGLTFSNTGAGAAVELDLPAAVPGLRFRAVRSACYDFDLDPSGTEVFRVDGDAGDYLRLDTDGDTVTIECFDTGIWDITAGYGGYAFEV